MRVVDRVHGGTADLGAAPKTWQLSLVEALVLQGKFSDALDALDAAQAFADSLRTRGINRIPMLFQHDPAEPVGVWLELREDHRGLYARGRLAPERRAMLERMRFVWRA